MKKLRSPPKSESLKHLPWTFEYWAWLVFFGLRYDPGVLQKVERWPYHSSLLNRGLNKSSSTCCSLSGVQLTK